jgi:hypothetical protein
MIFIAIADSHFQPLLIDFRHAIIAASAFQFRCLSAFRFYASRHTLRFIADAELCHAPRAADGAAAHAKRSDAAFASRAPPLDYFHADAIFADYARAGCAGFAIFTPIDFAVSFTLFCRFSPFLSPFQIDFRRPDARLPFDSFDIDAIDYCHCRCRHCRHYFRQRRISEAPLIYFHAVLLPRCATAIAFAVRFHGRRHLR